MLSLKRFLLLHGFAAVLLLSWIFQPTRALWDSLDQSAFHFLNGFVHNHPFWQNFWALASYKRFEFVMDGVRLIFFICILMATPPGQKRQSLAKMLFIVGFIFLSITLVGKTLFPKILQIERWSPTACDPDAFRLSQVIDWIYVKDHSLSSYPSDHGITASLFICCMFFLFKQRYGFAAIVTEGFYCLPRLVAGAHWLTDIVVGSLSVALILRCMDFSNPRQKLLHFRF